VYDIPDRCKAWLYNSHFTEISDISQSEMNGVVNFMGAEKESLHDYDIVPNFFVHRLDNDDMLRMYKKFGNHVIIVEPTHKNFGNHVIIM
jgi:hypothetical protein